MHFMNNNREDRLKNKEPSQRLDSIESRHLYRILVGIVATALILIGGAIYAYLHEFNGTFSHDQDVWGQFGDFLGGTLNPILSFLTLLALVFTLLLQSRQVEMQKVELENSKQELAATQEEMTYARKIAEQQVEQLRVESKKEDVFRTIQVLESRLESLYRESIYFISDGRLRKRELYFTLTFATPEALKQIIAPDVPPPPEYEEQLVQTKSVLMQLHLTIVKLSLQLTFLTQFDDSDAVLFFYEPTLEHLAKKLKAVGYLPPDDEVSLNINAEMRRSVVENRRNTNSSRIE